MNFTPIDPQACGGEGGECEIPWMSEYISALYQYGVGLAAVLAAVMIMVGGFIWLMSGGSPDKVGKAKDFIISALSGLFLALFSFMILNGINPRLVEIDPLAVVLPKFEPRSNDGYDPEYTSEPLADAVWTEVFHFPEDDDQVIRSFDFGLSNGQEFVHDDVIFVRDNETFIVTWGEIISEQELDNFEMMLDENFSAGQQIAWYVDRNHTTLFGQDAFRIVPLANPHGGN